jgi:hypothetical protein
LILFQNAFFLAVFRSSLSKSLTLCWSSNCLDLAAIAESALTRADLEKFKEV